MSPELRRAQSPFSLTDGGPFYHALARLRIPAPMNMARAWLFGVIVWLPLAISQVVRLIIEGGPLDPLVLDVSAHIRLLFTLPMLLASEPLLDGAVKSALASLYNGEFCDRAATDRILERAARLRDSRWVEAALLGVALLGGQLVLWGVFGSTGLFHGGEQVGTWSFPRIWYAGVALPFVQFLMFRWLWRWGIWSYVLAKISRVPLTPLMTHPDRAGGLSPLARPMTGFAGFVLATSAILAGAWGTQIFKHRTTLTELLPEVVVAMVTAMIIALAPLLLFCGQLFRARRRALAQYGDFARDYMLQFHEKWISSGAGGRKALGSSDIQSLNDLGGAFQVVAQSRIFVFGARNMFTVWFAGLLPMIPLLASTLTYEALLKRILSTVLGGIPL